MIKKAKFDLKNNNFEFDSNVKHQISGTAIGTKFAPPYTCMYMDYMENHFLKNEQTQPWIWFRYIYGLHGESVSQELTNSALDLVQVH